MVFRHPSEKSWSESQLGWFFPCEYGGKVIKFHGSKPPIGLSRLCQFTICTGTILLFISQSYIQQGAAPYLAKVYHGVHEPTWEASKSWLRTVSTDLFIAIPMMDCWLIPFRLVEPLFLAIYQWVLDTHMSGAQWKLEIPQLSCPLWHNLIQGRHYTRRLSQSRLSASRVHERKLKNRVVPSNFVDSCLTVLVGGFNPSEKCESQLGLLFPIYGKNKKCSKPPTSVNHPNLSWFVLICEWLSRWMTTKNTP